MHLSSRVVRLRENRQHVILISNIWLFNYRIHIYIESARDSFYCLPRNSFHPAKHDINNLQTKDRGAKEGSSTPQVCAAVSSEIIILSVTRQYNYSNHNRVCCLFGQHRSCTLNVKFVADDDRYFSGSQI